MVYEPATSEAGSVHVAVALQSCARVYVVLVQFLYQNRY